MTDQAPEPDEGPEFTEDEARQKARALELLLEAWETALKDDVEPQMLASTALFISLAEMVDIYGADAIALMAEELPERIRAGEFSFSGEDEINDH